MRVRERVYKIVLRKRGKRKQKTLGKKVMEGTKSGIKLFRRL